MENYFVYNEENSAEKEVYKYLLENCTQELFEKAKAQSKNIADAINYVMSVVREKAKNNCCMVSNEEVYGLIIHYFEEESIEKEDRQIGVASHNTKAKAEEEQEEPKVANKKPKAKAKKKPKEVKKAEPENVGYEQINLLDLL